MTREELAVVLGKSPNTIKEHIAKLKADGRLERIGSDRDGYWRVLNEKGHEKWPSIPIITIWRYLTQGYFVLKGIGELNKFTESNSLPTIASAYLKAYIDMFKKLPSMLAKRRSFRKKHRLRNIEMFNLIWKFHLSVDEIIGMRKR